MHTHYKRLTKPKRSPVYDTYWIFASRRFQVFKNRLVNEHGPWTDDVIIRNHRFTNVFRASDRVSQFLIQLQYQGGDAEDIFFKTLLFKLFNKIETFSYLQSELKHIDVNDFDFDRYDKLLTRQLALKNTIYSAAYIMPSAGSVFGYKFKHSNHLALLERMLKDRLCEKIQSSNTMKEVYELILEYPSLGNFLAFQYTIDINYSGLTDFSEMDFVVAGPGAKNGIAKCFSDLGDYTFEDVIKLMADDQEAECVRIGMELPNLWGRRLQLIDCQNLFCEVDKYLRVTNPELNSQSKRTRIKQKFLNGKGPIQLFFPPKWNINDKI